jgi:GTP 3',8-cyclase
MSVSIPRRLIDRFGRVHTSLRVSVTDACNIRCRYCMPAEVGGFLAQEKLLSYDSIERVVGVLARAGIRKVRLTGGEPLMRPNLPRLVEKLAKLDGLSQIAMTTNGMMLADSLDDLMAAGLTHINISLDTLQEATFRRLTRRDGLERVLQGVEAAVASSAVVRLNALVLRDLNLSDCVPLVHFAREKGIVIRFIEFMPLDAERAWNHSQMVSGEELRATIEAEFGPLIEAGEQDPSQPSRDFTFADGRGGIGFIDPISQPFCKDCNRLRLTADGKFRNCLFGKEEWDVRGLLEKGCSDAAICDLAMQSVLAKFASHGISDEGFRPPERAMYQIGG